MAFVTAGLPGPAAHAQPRPRSFEETVSRFEARFEPAEAKPGQTVTLKITVEPIPGYWTYPTVQTEEASSSSNRFVFPEGGDVIFAGPFEDPPGYKTKAVPDLMIKEMRYYPGPVTWERKAVVSPQAQPGPRTVTLKQGKRESKVQVCDDRACFNLTRPISTTLTVLPGPAAEVEPDYRDEVAKAIGLSSASPPAPKAAPPDRGPPAKGPGPKVAGPPDAAPPPKAVKEEGPAAVGKKIPAGADLKADLDAVAAQLPAGSSVAPRNTGLLGFLLTAVFWGAVTLLTPCVFPMIPITVSYFLKQGEKKLHNPLTMALVYSGTIVVVLGISAIVLLSVFRELSVDPVMNVALGLLFVFFALSLFGMFDLTLPNWLANYTGSREGKGGLLGTFFMALTFTIVSFTCVAPFLGGFGGMAASGNFSTFELALGGLAFAATFAAPFFVLSLFPSLIKKLPKSGGWMNTIKVLMGFLELAAALKFFRTAELRWQIPTELFTYDMVLGLWIALSVICGLYLLNVFRLPHDDAKDHIPVTQMLLGVGFIGLGLYLMPAMFAGSGGHERQRPRGSVYAWVDSFLLPEPSVTPSREGLAWSGDLRGVLDEARRTNQLVFVDFTGVTCTNCKLNEENVFPREDVKSLLKRYQLVQMYTDTIPASLYESPPDLDRRDHDAKKVVLPFQEKMFGTQQLPLYVILKPLPDNKTEVVGVYDEGKINDVAAFVEFLKKPLAPDTTQAKAR